MRLDDWVKAQGHGAIARLVKTTGLSRPTIYHALKGGQLRGDTAVKLSKATEGAVSVASLCGLTGESDKPALQDCADVQSGETPTEVAP